MPHDHHYLIPSLFPQISMAAEEFMEPLQVSKGVLGLHWPRSLTAIVLVHRQMIMEISGKREGMR
jgi:hypothetical protein